MAVDLQQLQAIHRIEGEVTGAIKGLKELQQRRKDVIEELPEFQALQDALQAVHEARARLKIAIRDDAALNRLETEIGEARFMLRDLREILSHHLVAYHEDTGRDVVKDSDSRTRQIELRARLGKPALDQPRLFGPFDHNFGVHHPIKSGMDNPTGITQN